ncbi:MAG: malic enzyme-like NAD(P)-binding protein [Kiritimatiellia bacterium]|jgi:malate dehydrogenase (oxaloacetate-decarboxylating)(NADP+)|nr:malate dehydrogenase [Kiritimatiellia bacterium]MDD4174469.1 malate dehydrogenase [Kiritimatiellia bacterium]MDD4442722.1 malate dehydrogenase [Kiritimatiellia bacterium]MDX9793490.1 malic enzyme-like NAD(P)-binding protein [Kiritimatiellia bacterium]
MAPVPVNRETVLAFHQGGKVGVRLTKPLNTQNDLCLAYTPGVAHAVKEIAAKPDSVFDFTAKRSLVAVVSDGTAILGLGDLGAAASIPVMEGKAVLFKAFGDVDAWPVPLAHCRRDGADTGKTDPQRVIDAVLALAPMYGGINLEDIAAPACFEIEDRLDAMLDIPVFHDDQWGTAVITLAGLLNYAQLCGRALSEIRVVMNGAGAAGIRIADMCKAAGVRDLVMCDTRGVIHSGRTDLNDHKRRHASDTPARTLQEALRGAHVFVGVSAADCVTADDVRGMADYPAIFAMSNPDPEIRPDIVADVMNGKPYVMATGRSDYPNQINNVLGFPYLFRGALDAHARTVNTAMKVAASEALAALAREPVPADVQALYPDERLEFGDGYVIPKPFDRRLFVEVSFAVARAAVESGAAPADTDLAALKASLEARNANRA